MRRRLIKLLACPECQGTIELLESSEENAVRILRGTLLCTSCARRYVIEKGVPRLVKTTEDVAEVGRRFSLQWMWRRTGRFETSGRCYGVLDEVCVGWINEQLQSRRAAAPGQWMLDAGCGSGEKAEVLARLCPMQNVVGLDLGVEPLEIATARYSDRHNLDFVQGNILEPPFKARLFDYGMSLGVLHHTPNTRRAFAQFRRVLKEEATLIIWIYPSLNEAPEWRLPYNARDRILFKQGHRIPPSLLRLLAHLMVIAFYPVAESSFKKNYRRLGKNLPFFDVDRMTRRQRYLTQVFLVFDTCLPRYQFRHTIKDVQSWFAEEGNASIFQTHGFYTNGLKHDRFSA